MAGPDTSTHHRRTRSTGEPYAVTLDRTFDADDLQTVRREVAERAGRLGVPEARVEGLLLVVSELVTNAVRHGGGTGRIRLWVRGPYVYCQVTDAGPGIGDPLAGTEAPDVLATDGRGIWICRQVCNELIIADRGRGVPGTTVIAVLSMDSPPPGAERQPGGDAPTRRDQRSPHAITRPTIASGGERPR